MGSKISPFAGAIRHSLFFYNPRFFGCWLGGWGGGESKSAGEKRIKNRMASEQYRGGEEVDLGELFKSVWAQKVLIAGLTLALLLLAALYAFTRQPVYQADLAIVAPSHNDISLINYGRGEATGLAVITVKDVYELYARHLYSENARRKVFEEIFFPSLSESQKAQPQNVLFTRFSRLFVISKTGDDAAARYVVSVSDSEPAAAVKLADALANTAAEMTKGNPEKDFLIWQNPRTPIAELFDDETNDLRRCRVRR
ncbi:Wzz/FepE/Etk N-terminal domain-containing protein, partial [Pseudomonas sp. NY11226]|uniref:Wzz/FepE/Etk N-terminal domain-containing protein n=1 Tax=Pseudomonas sp. NY11226 TaxID=3400362 RepID=UPI003A875913